MHLFPKCQSENYLFCDFISPLLKGNDKDTAPQNEEGLLVVCSDVPPPGPVILPIGKTCRLVCALAQARSGPGDSPGRGFSGSEDQRMFKLGPSRKKTNTET